MMYGAITFKSTLEIPSTPEEPLFLRCCIVFKNVFVSFTSHAYFRIACYKSQLLLFGELVGNVFDSFCNLEILRKYPLMGKEYEYWIACEVYTGYKHKMKLLGENEWDDDAEWVKEYVGDINGCYHYKMFDNEDGTNSEEDKDLPVLLKF